MPRVAVDDAHAVATALVCPIRARVLASAEKTADVSIVTDAAPVVGALVATMELIESGPLPKLTAWLKHPLLDITVAKTARPTSDPAEALHCMLDDDLQSDN